MAYHWLAVVRFSMLSTRLVGHYDQVDKLIIIHPCSAPWGLVDHYLGLMALEHSWVWCIWSHGYRGSPPTCDSWEIPRIEYSSTMEWFLIVADSSPTGDQFSYAKLPWPWVQPFPPFLNADDEGPQFACGTSWQSDGGGSDRSHARRWLATWQRRCRRCAAVFLKLHRSYIGYLSHFVGHYGHFCRL